MLSLDWLQDSSSKAMRSLSYGDHGEQSISYKLSHVLFRFSIS